MSTPDRTPTRFLSPFAPEITYDGFRREVFTQIGQMLMGKINMATARWMVLKKFRELRFDPACGFPPEHFGDQGIDLPLGNAVELMLRAEMLLIRGERRWREGNEDFARHAWPAWELVQCGWVGPKADCADARPGEWELRWRAAGESVCWKGARKPRMWAFKESPIWEALGAGAGGFADALGYPYPPFALGSWKDWRAVSREEWFGGLGPAETKHSSMRNEVREAMDQLGPGFREALLKELEDFVEGKKPQARDPKEIDAAFDALTPEQLQRLRDEWSK